MSIIDKSFAGRDKITIKELAEQLQIRYQSAVGLVNGAKFLRAQTITH